MTLRVLVQLCAVILILGHSMSAAVGLEQPTSVVALAADTSEEAPCGGAAVIINSDGLALTLLEALPASALTNTAIDFTFSVIVNGCLRRDAVIVRRGSKTTAVLIQIKDMPVTITPMTIGDSALAKVGDVVWTAGNSFGALEIDGAPALSRGVISGRYLIPADSPPVRGRGGRELSTYRGEVFEIDAALNDGNQGGAVVDDAGRLIGLGSLGTMRPRKLGTVVPLHLILRDLELNVPVNNKVTPVVDAQTQKLISNAGKIAPGLVLVYMERTSGPGNPQSIPRPPRLTEEVPKHERERMERWWNAYYHQQQMFFTDQAITATIIDAEKGLLLTSNSNLHGDTNRGEVLLSTGSINCKVLARNLPLDLALLKADAPLPTQAISLSPSPQLSVGQAIAVIGRHRGDNGFTSTIGVVSTTTRRKQQTDAVFAQTDAMANYGSLGGVVVDIAGAVVGMMVLLGPDGDDLPWAINSGVALFVDSASILRALPGLIEGKTTRRAPFIGLGIQMRFARGSGHPSITSVSMGTGAEEAGIIADDILISVDGIDALSSMAITRALIRHRAGDVVEVVVERDGDKVTVPVEIRAFKDEP